MSKKIEFKAEVRYGLWHVNRKTGEKVPFLDDSAHNLREQDAKIRVQDLNIGKGRGMAYHDDWIVEACPDQLVVP